MALKGLSFKTEWLEMPDIEPRMKALGAEPTSLSSAWDERPLYTLPVIHDHSTGRVVSDSMQIALYLDDAYPDRPMLLPLNARAPIVVFESVFVNTAIRPGEDVVNHEAFRRLAPASFNYICRTRGDEYMTKVAKISTPGNPQRRELWSAAQVGFSKVSEMLSTNGQNSPFFYGSTLSFADFIVVGHLLWMKASLGVESREWKGLEEWDGGRWMKLLKSTEKYQALGE